MASATTAKFYMSLVLIFILADLTSASPSSDNILGGILSAGQSIYSEVFASSSTDLGALVTAGASALSHLLPSTTSTSPTRPTASSSITSTLSSTVSLSNSSPAPTAAASTSSSAFAAAALTPSTTTNSAAITSQPSSPPRSDKTLAIALGTVLGSLLLASILVGLCLFCRRRRRRRQVANSSSTVNPHTRSGDLEEKYDAGLLENPVSPPTGTVSPLSPTSARSQSGDWALSARASVGPLTSNPTSPAIGNRFESPRLSQDGHYIAELAPYPSSHHNYQQTLSRDEHMNDRSAAMRPPHLRLAEWDEGSASSTAIPQYYDHSTAADNRNTHWWYPQTRLSPIPQSPATTCNESVASEDPSSHHHNSSASTSSSYIPHGTYSTPDWDHVRSTTSRPISTPDPLHTYTDLAPPAIGSPQLPAEMDANSAEPPPSSSYTKHASYPNHSRPHHHQPSSANATDTTPSQSTLAVPRRSSKRTTRPTHTPPRSELAAFRFGVPGHARHGDGAGRTVARKPVPAPGDTRA